MEIIVFGASGRTGKHLVRQGLERGHSVTAFVRDPAKIGITHENLKVFKGDVLNPADVSPAMMDKDAVLAALGFSKGSPETICADGTKNMIAAMTKYGVKRLVVESAYGAGDTRNRDFYARALLIIRSRIIDKEEMEKAIEASGLDWVIARPVALTDGGKTGHYRAGMDLNLNFFPRVSRADVADFMLNQIEDDRFLHKMPVVSG